jgi:hypothetical protein
MAAEGNQFINPFTAAFTDPPLANYLFKVLRNFNTASFSSGLMAAPFFIIRSSVFSQAAASLPAL